MKLKDGFDILCTWVENLLLASDKHIFHLKLVFIFAWDAPLKCHMANKSRVQRAEDTVSTSYIEVLRQTWTVTHHSSTLLEINSQADDKLDHLLNVLLDVVCNSRSESGSN